MKFLSFNENPSLSKIIGEHLAKTEVPLWCMAMAVGHHPGRPILTHTAARKVKKAFRVALRATGYDHVGRRLPGKGDGGASVGKSNATELYGTARLHFRTLETIEAPFSELVDHFTGIITKHLEPSIGRTAPGAIERDKQGERAG